MKIVLGWVAVSKSTNKPHTGGAYRAGTKLYTSEAVARHAMWGHGESGYTYHEVTLDTNGKS